MMKVFMNDRVVDSADAVIDSRDRGLLLGDGIFETLRVAYGRLIFFDEHFDRLSNSAQALGFKLAYNRLQLKKQCQQLVQVNQLQNTHAAIRITLTRGVAGRGIDILASAEPTLLITISPYPLVEDFYPRVWVTTIRRDPSSPLAQHKTLSYLDCVIARAQARAHGYDEGIICNSKMQMIECACANLFLLLTDGRIITAHQQQGVLPGIVRQVILKLAEDLRLPVELRAIEKQQLDQVVEAWQTNSLIGIQPIRAINDYQLAVKKSSLTQSLMTAYSQVEQAYES